MSDCKCSIAISVLGDGCRYCQPQEYINQLNRAYEETDKENDELLEKTEDLERQLAEARELAEEILDSGYFESTTGLSYVARIEQLKDQPK